MRKYVKILIPVIGITLFAFLGFKVVAKIQYKDEVARDIQHLSDFSYQNLNGENFTQYELKPEKPVVFIYFNSECDYCQQEAVEIKEHQGKLKDTQVVFISTEAPEVIKDFARRHKLAGYDGIHFLFDQRGDFAKTFDATTVPFILIYNENLELVEKRKGQAKVSFILNALAKDRGV